MESNPLATPAQLLALITMIVTELVNDTVIDGHWAKIITGIAGILVPVVWMAADAVIHHAHAKVEAAKLYADSGATTTPHITKA